ncbi:MAG: hypothetical protein K0R57_4361 [Paenibacillaceae bacterium]|jgi:DUF4097 and DUF4098 domain-containing protein YvlB|nr:hypothetical protein [Paenibacillaceae bacterium]
MRVAWNLKKIALVALACFVMGAVGLIMLYQNGAMDQLAVPVDIEKVIDGKKVQSFSISSTTAKITFVPSSGDELKIRLAGELPQVDLPFAGIEVKERGDSEIQVQVNTTKKFMIGMDVNRIFTFSRKMEVTVELPDKVYKNLKAQTDTGDLSVSPVAADTMELESDTGEITVQGFTGSKLEASSDTGTLRLANVSAGLELRSNTGNIIVGLKRLTAPGALNTDTGDIRITMEQAFPVGVDFRTDTGEVTATDNFAPFTADAKEKRKLQGKLDSGGPLIRARTDTGDIHIGIE